jgi:amidase
MRKDPYKAFMPYPENPPPHQEGPLSGLTFAVKDLFDVAGYPTGCGQPHVLAHSGLCETSAAQVESLLDEGARFVGKTHLVEMAYSLTGRNVHFGTPINPKAPDRLPGGSSSGSAVAVAARMADIGLASDTLGSIRVPASYCGLYGLRPSHARLSTQGMSPLAPSLDTPGWLTRDADTLIRLAFTLLKDQVAIPKPQRFIIPKAFLEGASPEVLTAFETFLKRMEEHFGTVETLDLDPDMMDRWSETVRTIQGYEAWEAHGPMIMELMPSLGPGIRERFEWARSVTQEDYERATAHRHADQGAVYDLLEDACWVFPSAPAPAPLRTCPESGLEDHRRMLLRQTAFASLFRLPELSAPFLSAEGLPVGVSLVGARGLDLALCILAGEIALHH